MLAAPRSDYDEVIPIAPTSSEKDVKGNNIGVDLLVHQEKVGNGENSLNQMEILRSEFNMLSLHNVELITHDEVLTRISLDDSLCYIMFDDPIELSSVIENVAELSSLKSLVSTYAYTYKFNLIRDYGVDDKFYVYQICITCDKLAELKLHVLRKQQALLLKLISLGS